MTTKLTGSWIDRLLRPAMPKSGAVCEQRTNQEPYMRNVVMEADEAECNPCCVETKRSNLGSSARLWGSSGRFQESSGPGTLMMEGR